MSTTLAAVPAGLAELAGYVEAVTADAVLGWAWSPHDAALRVVVQLRLDGEVLASAEADLAREDLARNGIGDGRHAFRLAVPAAARARVGELRVTGLAASGAAVPLGQPPAAGDLSERLDRLQRGVDMMLASQRVLHRNLQAALLQAERAGDGGADASGGTKAEAAAEGRAVVAEQLRALEIFVVRLDQRLADLAAPTAVALPGPVAGPGFGRVGAALGLVAMLLLGALGLYRSLAGG